ncbi:MAG: glycosyltransferase family 4 protein [Chitinophagales bacterium]
MQANRRVLIFLPFLTYGGAESQGILLAKGLKEQGYKVTVCGFNLPGSNYPLIAELDQLGIAHYILPFEMSVMPGRKRIVPALLSFIRYINRGSFHAVIPFTFWPNYLTAHAARFIKAQSFWNQRSVDDHVSTHAYEKWLPLKQLTFVSNSIPGKKFLMQRFGLSEKRITIINNGLSEVAPKNTVAYWHQQLHLQNRAVLIMVANFFPEKDFATVINGVHLLKQQGISVICVFVGAGGDANKRNQVKALAFDLGLANEIIFTGSCNDVSGLLRACTIGVLSSLSEGCPNSILEYMQTGLPVVANNIDAIADVLGSDYPYLFNSGDANDFALKVKSLLEDKTVALQTGLALQQRVNASFSAKKMIDSFVALLK